MQQAFASGFQFKAAQKTSLRSRRTRRVRRRTGTSFRSRAAPTTLASFATRSTARKRTSASMHRASMRPVSRAARRWPSGSPARYRTASQRSASWRRSGTRPTARRRSPCPSCVPRDERPDRAVHRRRHCHRRHPVAGHRRCGGGVGERRRLRSGAAADGSRANVRTLAYSECQDNVAVELFIVEGGGHTWPGAPRKSAVARRDDARGQRDGRDLAVLRRPGAGTCGRPIAGDCCRRLTTVIGAGSPAPAVTESPSPAGVASPSPASSPSATAAN